MDERIKEEEARMSNERRLIRLERDMESMSKDIIADVNEGSKGNNTQDVLEDLSENLKENVAHGIKT